MEKKIYSINNNQVIEINFKNKEDLIWYLKNANTSSNFQGQQLHSQNVSSKNNNFVKTESFEQALDFFEYGWYDDFDIFLYKNKQINKHFPFITKKNNYYNNLFGSSPNVVNALKGQPLSMRKKYETNFITKNIQIHYNVGYPGHIESKQIYNNGLLTLSLIDFLESIGYIVDLSFDVLLKTGNQILYIKILLKAPGEKINLQKMYFSFCNPSFARRLIYRVIETTEELGEYWKDGYGKCINYYNNTLNDNSIFIKWPNLMGVEGINIQSDINTFLKKINLDNYINIEENNNVYSYKRKRKNYY